MKFLELHQLSITLLTPVHIGCGEDYTPVDYVIEDDALFAFDSASVSKALPKNARDQLLGLVKGKRQQDVLTSIQKLFYEHREELLAIASHHLPVASGVAELYQKRIGQTAQLERDGKRVVNRLEIERTFYNPSSQRPVIPGSSLKGAIRTALLDWENKGEAGRHKEKNKELQQRVFRYEKFEQDPMRLVQLGDSEICNGNGITREIRFAVNRPRNEPKPGQSKQTMAADKGLSQLLETLSDFSPRAYNSRLTLHQVGQLQESDKLPEARFQWTVEQIARACNRFYLPLLEQEMEIIGQRRYASPEWEQRMHRFLQCVNPLLESNKAMLLRIGRHSGAEAVILNDVRSIKIMSGRDESGKSRSKNEAQPHTLWLASDATGARSAMTPFGWVLVEIDPPDTLPTDLKNIISVRVDTGQEWMEKQRLRITRAKDKVTGDRQREAEQEQAQVTEQQAEKERQERLASMTEVQRAIEELREGFEKARASRTLSPQSVVPDRLAGLLKGAKDWSKKDREELCNLAEEIYRSLDMLKGKKGRERRERVKQLRE